jgi:glycosyl transferase family 25
MGHFQLISMPLPDLLLRRATAATAEFVPRLLTAIKLTPSDLAGKTENRLETGPQDCGWGSAMSAERSFEGGSEADFVQSSGSEFAETAGGGSLWPIFIVSLADAVERRRQCKATMDQLRLPFEFIDAVDGSRLSAREVDTVYEAQKDGRPFKRPLAKAEIGCYLSHYALWCRIAKSAEEGAIVLEDDFNAEPNLVALLADISRISLASCVVKLYARKAMAGRTLATLNGGYRLLMPEKIPAHTLGYALDRQAAEKLASRALPFNRPVDIDLKHWWKFDVTVLAVDPPALLVREEAAGSTIEESRSAAKPNGPFGDLVRFSRNIRYQVAYRAALLKTRGRKRQTLEQLTSQINERRAAVPKPVPDGVRRRNLVVVRAGKNSLHQQWLNAGSKRNWDLVVSLYDPDASFDHDEDVMVVRQCGGKWDGLYALFSQADILSNYDFVWLPDDDISTNSGAIDTIFDEMKKNELDVAQPSLTRDSYFSHFALMSCPAFQLRYTNFVEIMAPCLKTSLVQMILEDISESMSGFGLDYIWCRLSEETRYKAAIIDHVAIRHARAVGRVLRGQMSKDGVVPENEELALRARYNVQGRIRPLIYAAIDKRGRLHEGCARLGVAMSLSYLFAYRQFTAQESPGWKILQLLRRQMTRKLDLSRLRRVEDRSCSGLVRQARQC